MCNRNNAVQMGPNRCDCVMQTLVASLCPLITVHTWGTRLGQGLQ